MKPDWTKSLARWGKRPAATLDAAMLALVADSDAAGRLRAYQNNPAVAALTIERTRDRLDIFGWLFIFAGLAYTTVNVQKLIAGDTPAWDLAWIVAWTVEPMVMGLMLVLLRGEQIANRHGEPAGGWVRFTRWASLLITYVMNTLESWHKGDLKQGFIHSVPVIMVFLASEALVQQRLTLTTVVDKASRGRDEPPADRVHGELIDEPRVIEESRAAELTWQQRDSAPEPVVRTQTPVVPTATPSDEVGSARTLKERAWEAFRRLADEATEEGRSIDEIGPAEVDRRAGLEGRGVAKVSGRMAEFRGRWVNDRQGGGAGDGDEAVG